MPVGEDPKPKRSVILISKKESSPNSGSFKEGLNLEALKRDVWHEKNTASCPGD